MKNNKIKSIMSLEGALAKREAKVVSSKVLSRIGLKSVNDMTQEEFMNYTASIAGRFIQENDTLSVGSLTVYISACVQLYLLGKKHPDKMIELFKRSLANSEIIKILEVGSIEDLNGTADYISVVPVRENLEEVKIEVVFMSEQIMNAMIQQLKTMAFNEDNVRRFLFDLNICGRMWQELTIDAAKKLYKVFIPFYQEMVKAMSTVRLLYSLPSFERIKNKELSFEIYRKGLASEIRPELGQSHFELKPNGDVKREYFGDVFSVLQDEQMTRLESFVNGPLMEVYEKTNLSEVIINDLNLNGILNESNALALDLIPAVVYRYNNAIGKVMNVTADIEENKELRPYEKAFMLTKVDKAYRDEIESISNDARYFTSHLSASDAGKTLMAASYGFYDRKSKGVIVKGYKPSKAYLNIAKELGASYVIDAYSKVYSENNLAGSPLLGKDVRDIKEGDKIEFSLGVSLAHEDLYVEDSISEVLVAKEFNGKMYATKSIVDMLEVNRVECTAPEVVSVQVYKKVDEVIKEATSFTIHPLYFTVNENGKRKANYNVIVASIPSVDDPEEITEVIAANYLCYSAHFENIIAGATFESFVTTNTDDKANLLQVPLKDFIEVKRNNSVEAEEDIFGNNAEAKMEKFNREKAAATNSKEVEEDPFADIVVGSNKAVETSKETDEEDPFGETSETAKEASKLLNEVDWSFLGL